MENFDELKELLRRNPDQNITITMHQRPDGDAMGSTLALWQYLRKKGWNASVVSPTSFPEYFKWMKGAGEVIVYPDDHDRAAEVIRKSGLVFCLDFNELRRVEPLDKFIVESGARLVLLDHHLEPDPFEFHWSDTRASSTCEIVFQFIERMEGGHEIVDRDMAYCIYTGLVTDTGNFQNANTSVRSFELAAILLGKGIDLSVVQEEVFNTYRKERLRFVGNALLNRMEVIEEIGFAYITVSRQDAERYNLQDGDTEGLVNFPLSIHNVKVSALLKEHVDKVKISLRSKGDVPVNDFAKAYFNGGGHKNASGGSSRLSLQQTASRMVELMKNHLS